MSKFRRQIFYISGFDPRGAGYYYTLYRDEVEKLARISGEPSPRISSRQTTDIRTHWQVETDDCLTDYTFLAWDDIVRDRWRKRKSRFSKDVLATYRSYLTRYRNITASRISSAPLIMFYYPPVFVLISLLLTLVAVMAGGWKFWLLLPVLATALFFAFRKWQPTWLLHTFSFNRCLCEDDTSDIDARCAQYADHIAAAVNAGTHDEILLVGHSNGATLVILTLDKLQKTDVDTSKIKILTLGQFLQMITLHQGGEYMRRKLEQLRTISSNWLDISAMADPACFPQVGPFYHSAPTPPNLTVASPRLHTLYDAQTYQKLRRDKFNFHFLYLKCSDKIGAYNYPRITLSPQPLETHIEHIKQDTAAHA